MILTKRDLDFVQTLTICVPILAIAHIMAIWWPQTSNQRTVRRRLAMLRHFGWIEQYTVNAHRPRPVTQPMFTWRPGTAEPDAGYLADQSKSHWSQPAHPTEVFVASRLAACLCGSTARRLPPVEHCDHDLRLASVYAHYRQEFPQLAAMWLGQHARPKAGYQIKDPDVLLRDDKGLVVRVIQAIGRSSAAQIERFHEHCVENNLPYELW
jgi:hypothetical protein